MMILYYVWIHTFFFVFFTKFSSCKNFCCWKFQNMNTSSEEEQQQPMESQSQRSVNAPASPLVIVPGLGGSRLYATLHKDHRLNPFCAKDLSRQTRLWPPILSFLPVFQDCWVDNIRLHFNEATQEFSDTKGVNISIPGFGETLSNEYLVDVKLSALQYFHNLVQNAVLWGYKRNVSIRAAPYDFRRALLPVYQDPFHERLQHLIKDTYEINGGQKVSLLCHSLGCLVTLRFLQQKSQFASKYVRRFIVMGGPLGGSLEATRAVLSGSNWDISTLDTHSIRKVQQSWPSMHLLQPRPWLTELDDGQPIVVSPTRNYSMTDLKQLYDDADPILWKQFEVSTAEYLPTKPPNVETYCIAGTEMPTPVRLIYNNTNNGKSVNLRQFIDAQPLIVKEDGDGTVLSKTIDFLCQHWKKQQVAPVYVKMFPNAGHMGMLSDCRVTDYIRSILTPRVKQTRLQNANGGGSSCSLNYDGLI